MSGGEARPRVLFGAAGGVCVLLCLSSLLCAGVVFFFPFLPKIAFAHTHTRAHAHARTTNSHAHHPGPPLTRQARPQARLPCEAPYLLYVHSSTMPYSRRTTARRRPAAAPAAGRPCMMSSRTAVAPAHAVGCRQCSQGAGPLQYRLRQANIGGSSSRPGPRHRRFASVRRSRRGRVASTPATHSRPLGPTRPPWPSTVKPVALHAVNTRRAGSPYSAACPRPPGRARPAGFRRTFAGRIPGGSRR